MALLWMRWIVLAVEAVGVDVINAVNVDVIDVVGVDVVGIVAHLGAGCRRRHITISFSLFLLFHKSNGFCEGAKFWIVTFCCRRRCRCDEFVTFVSQLLLFVDDLHGQANAFQGQ